MIGAAAIVAPVSERPIELRDEPIRTGAQYHENVHSLVQHAEPTAATGQTAFSHIDLDSNGDGKVSLTKSRDGFKAKQTITLCPDLPRFTYAVKCPVAPLVSAIAAARVTTACKDLGANAQWTYASKGGTYGNACITRAMDAVPLDGALGEPRVFQDITLASSRHFITQKGNAWKAFGNVLAQRIDVGVRKRGFYIRGQSHDWLIQDFRIRGIGVNTAVGDITVGIGMAGAKNITIRRGHISNFIAKYPAGKYLQGDGISNERFDTADISDVVVEDVSDGAFDLKGTTRLDRVRGVRAGHYTLRRWATITAGTVTSENPGNAHVQLAAASADITIAKLIAVGSKPIVTVDSHGIGGKITIRECDLSKWTGNALLYGFYTRAKVLLGKGCVLLR